MLLVNAHARIASRFSPVSYRRLTLVPTGASDGWSFAWLLSTSCSRFTLRRSPQHPQAWAQASFAQRASAHVLQAARQHLLPEWREAVAAQIFAPGPTTRASLCDPAAPLNRLSIIPAVKSTTAHAGTMLLKGIGIRQNGSASRRRSIATPRPFSAACNSSTVIERPAELRRTARSEDSGRGSTSAE